MKRDIIVDRCKFTNVNRNRYTYAEQVQFFDRNRYTYAEIKRDTQVDRNKYSFLLVLGTLMQK